mgnify:CR=1 FL=1
MYADTKLFCPYCVIRRIVFEVMWVNAVCLPAVGIRNGCRAVVSEDDALLPRTVTHRPKYKYCESGSKLTEIFSVIRSFNILLYHSFTYQLYMIAAGVPHDRGERTSRASSSGDFESLSLRRARGIDYRPA